MPSPADCLCVCGGGGGAVEGGLCDGCCFVLAPEEKTLEAGTRSGDGSSRLLFLGLVLALMVSLVLVALVTFLISKYTPHFTAGARLPALTS